MNTFVVDTHALVWYLDGDKRLSHRAASSMDLGDATLVIPTVVLAEVKYLFKRRRISVSFADVLSAIQRDKRCIVYPFDLLCLENLDDKLDLHDGVIAATALVFRSSLDPATSVITKDRAMRELGIVETVW